MKKWQLRDKIKPDFINENSEINPLLLQILFNRGLKDKDSIQSFLSGSGYHDPFLFKNMASAVDLIIKNIKNRQQIVVYGDYDADGVTSAAILLEVLNILHAKTKVYLPDRSSEGYGLNKEAIDKLDRAGTKLIITVDNGIRNKEEVIYAQKLGLDVIITDHHVLPDNRSDLPPCLYINPADPDDNYPWKYLAGVGVAFKLLSALLTKANISEKQKQLIREKCLDLVAVGTVADMVSLLGENRVLVKDGLEILNKNKRLGLNELIKIAKINDRYSLQAWNIAWQIAPRLNAASRLAHANTAFALLTTNNEEEAKDLAQELNQRNLERQEITAKIIAQAEEQIDPNNLPLIIFVIAPEREDWNEGVIGLVAGRLTQKYYRPTFVVSRSKGENKKDSKIVFKSSGRSIEEFNLIKAVSLAAEYLDKYGGHPMACGFSLVGKDKLIKFKAKLEEIATKELKGMTLLPKLKIDAELKFSDINLDLAEELKVLAPFGQHNPQACFLSYNLRITDINLMGLEQQHIKLRLSVSKEEFNSNLSMKYIWAISFGGAEKYAEFKVGDQIDLVYYLELNDFNGRREAQLKILDIKLHNN